MPKVVYAPGVERDLYGFPRDVFELFQSAFDALERDPVDPGPPYRTKRVRGKAGNRAIRFEGWGAIYRVEGTQVWILKVGPRSTLYHGR